MIGQFIRHKHAQSLVMTLNIEHKILSLLQLLNVIVANQVHTLMVHPHSQALNGSPSLPGPSMQIWEEEGPGEVTGSIMATD